MYCTFFFNVDAVVCQNNGQFQVWELNIWQFIVIVEIKYFLNLNDYYLPIFIISIYFRQTSFFKSPKTFRVIITIISCCSCYMPKYVPRLEGIMPSNLGTYKNICMCGCKHIFIGIFNQSLILISYIIVFEIILYKNILIWNTS